MSKAETKETENNVVDIKENDTAAVQLTNEERLEFENMELKRNNLELQLAPRQIELTKKIKSRTGVDISNWNINIFTGVAIKPEEPNK